MNAPVESSPALAPTRPGGFKAGLQAAGGRHAGVLGGFTLAATLILALAHTFTREPIEARALEDLRQLAGPGHPGGPARQQPGRRQL
jgi:hypothetical protein